MSSIYQPVHWSPGTRDLRLFGCLTGVALALLTAVVAWRLGHVPAFAKVTWPLAGVLFLLGALCPGALLWPYRCWMRVTVPVGLGLQCLALAVFYYGVLTPVGLGFRLFGRDPLHRRFEAERPSYWDAHRSVDDQRRYFRQF